MSNRRSSWKKKKKNREPPPPVEPDTSAAIGDTDLTHKNVKIYLVKLPDMLAQQFQRSPGDEKEIIGRLRIPSGAAAGEPGTVQEPRIFLDKVRATKTMPKDNVVTEYDIEFKEEETKVMVFSQSRIGENAEMRMEGKVSHHGIARPKMDAKYRNVSKRRTLMSHKRNREIVLMGESERRAVQRDEIRPMSMTETLKDREKRKKKKEDARRHLDVPSAEYQKHVRLAVFKAFAIQAHYFGDELSKVTATGMQQLRPIISEVCAYNKSGPFQGQYDLKDEYKTVTQRQQKNREWAAYEQEQLELLQKKREENAEREKEAQGSKKQRLS